MVRNEKKGARTTATPTSPAFQIGEEVEARLSSEGSRGAWYKAEVIAHNVSLSGQQMGYIVKYKTIMKDEELNEPKIDLVSERNIRKVLTFSPKGKRGGSTSSNEFSASVSKKQKNQASEQITESKSESANDNANDKQHESEVYLSDMEEAKPIISHRNTEQLPFKKVNPLWNRVPQVWDIFNKIPQNPHFKNLNSISDGSVEDDVSREVAALSLMAKFASLTISVESLTVKDDMATFHRRLKCADDLEKNGFNVDPIRAHMMELLRVKSELFEGRSKLSEWEHKLSEQVQENLGVLCSQTQTEEELSAVRNKKDELRSEIIRLDGKLDFLIDKNGKLKKQADGNQRYMSEIQREIFSLKEFVENREGFPLEPSWRN